MLYIFFMLQTIIRDLLTEAVEKRLMGNRQFGFMLSGGLDSSLIAGFFPLPRIPHLASPLKSFGHPSSSCRWPFSTGCLLRWIFRLA